jgi:murein DD-endopeptidase MepM/ murein hydrolase activator NlpD
VPRSRHRRLGVLASAFALVLIFGTSLGGSPDRPIGQVRGAVGTPAPSLAGDSAGVVAPAFNGFSYARATDPDAPPTLAQRLPTPASRLTGYIWPLAFGRITLPFKAIPGGTTINNGRLWHDGVDLASFCGDRVRAAHDGVVLAAGRHFDDVIGWVGDLSHYYSILDRKHMWNDLPIAVVTDDGNGYRSIYAHFAKVVVRKGQVVHAGQLIGYEGMTGHASGCHVHFGLFNPSETRTFGIRADILRKLRVPRFEIARVDPLLVLPGGEHALHSRRIPRSTATATSPPSSAPMVPAPTH